MASDRSPKKKDAQVRIRIDQETRDRLEPKVKRIGGWGAVVRALLDLFDSGEVDRQVEELAAKQKKRPKRRKDQDNAK